MATNIICKRDCEYQKEGNCYYDKIEACIINHQTDCMYYTPNKYEKPNKNKQNP